MHNFSVNISGQHFEIEKETTFFLLFTILFARSRDSNHWPKMKWMESMKKKKPVLNGIFQAIISNEQRYQKSNFMNESCCSFHFYPWATQTHTHIQSVICRFISFVSFGFCYSYFVGIFDFLCKGKEWHSKLNCSSSFHLSYANFTMNAE